MKIRKFVKNFNNFSGFYLKIKKLVDLDDIYFDFDEVLGVKKKKGKKYAKIKWSRIGGVDFKP